MINLVHQYTGRTVDIVAYGEGSAIARKAVIGGECADTGVMVESQLAKVQTYISEEGINQGIYCSYSTTHTCQNMVTGLNCNSKFMKDINSNNTLPTDEVQPIFYSIQFGLGIARNECGSDPYEIPGAHQVYRLLKSIPYGVPLVAGILNGNVQSLV